MSISRFTNGETQQTASLRCFQLYAYFLHKKTPSYDFSYEGIPTELVAASGFEPLTFGL